MPLGCLAAGACGEIAEVIGRVEHVHRLREMGLRDGVRIEIVQSGSPCILRVNGQRLCFRDCDAMGVLVRTAAAACIDSVEATVAPTAVTY
ncbi:MAG: FeoA domain-containing protein [Pirellulales bacterium]